MNRLRGEHRLRGAQEVTSQGDARHAGEVARCVSPEDPYRPQMPDFAVPFRKRTWSMNCASMGELRAIGSCLRGR